MRTSIIEVVTASLLICSNVVFGAELSDYEKTCLDLGFKKRTPAYGECVLELDKRSTDQQKQAERARVEQQRQAQEQQERQAAQQRQQQEQQRAARGDGTPDHQTCNKYGFVAGTAPYAECRQKIDLARREAAQKQAAYELELKRYEAEKERHEQQVAEYEKEKERQRGLAMMRFGAALMSGTSPYASENFANAGRASLGLPPIAPSRPQIQNYTITTPGGRMVNCNSVGNDIHCF